MKLTKLKKHLAMLLSAAMVFTCLPATAMAAQADDDLVEEGAVIEDVEDEEASDVSAIEEAVDSVSNNTASGNAAEGVYKFTSYKTVPDDIKGIEFVGFSAHSGGHGPTGGKDSKVKISLEKKAMVIIEACEYGKGAEVTASSGKVTKEEVVGEAKADAGATYTIREAEAGVLDVTFGGTVYVHAITVMYPIAPAAEGVHSFTSYKTVPEDVQGIVFNGFSAHSGGHGPTGGKDSSVTIGLEGKANVVIEACEYGKGATATASSGTLEAKDAAGAVKSDAGTTYTITGAKEGNLNVTFGSTVYVHAITVTYVMDPVAEGVHNFTSYKTVPEDVKGIKFVGFSAHSGGHGPIGGKDSAVKLGLEKPATVTIEACEYGKGNDLTASSGTVKASEKAGEVKGDKGMTYVITGAEAGTFTATFGSTVYVHAITVQYGEEEIDPATCVAEGEYKYVGIKSAEEFEALEHTGIKLKNFSWHGETYGLTDLGKGGSIELTLASDAIVTVEQGYGTGVELETTSGRVSVVNNTGIYTKGEGQIFTVAGLKKGKQVLNFAKATGYLSCLKVFYINSGKVYNHDEIELYDFSGDAVKTDAQGGSYYTKAVKTINGSDKINYRITNKEINSWYGTGAEVKDGVNFPSAFTMKDVSGNKLLAYDGVGKTNNRLRTLNDKVVRYDTRGLNMNKELPEYVAYDEATDNKDTANSAYPGYFYSNNGSNPNVYVAVATDEGDKVTAVLASNGTDSEIHFENMVDKEDGQVFNYTGAGYGEPHEFYAAADSLYKFYSTNEKLCVARIIVEHAQYATVSGNVDTSATTGLPSDYKIRFTNKLSGEKKDVSVESGKYTVELPSGFGYEYELSLIDANGFVIKSDRILDLKEKKTSASLDVKIENVPLAKITGKITGLNEVSLKRVQLSTKTSADVVYVPEFKIDRTTGDFVAQYEVGVEYTLIAKDVEDYTLAKTTVKYDADKTEDIVFNAKPTYKVTVKSNIDTKELVSANFIFTLLEGDEFTPSALYTYEFKGVDDIKLRDGQYKVVVRNSGKYVQKLTADVKVAGKAVDAEINFTDDVRLWDFASADYTSRAAEYKNNLTAGVESNYNGLTFKGGQVNKTYLLQGAGYVKVPVKGNATIKASACYQYDFYFKDETEPSVGQKTGSTGQIDTFTYDYKGEAGYVTITTKSTTYFTSIEVVYPVAYKAEVTVGADAEYKTINEALDAVKSMDRKDGENTKPVTVKIQPGDYQEMLVIDVPNIKFVNAAEKPDTVLKNKGVEIGENAVRITGYYGHGYTYYSMDSNCKYDAELLEINKKNGYPSFINPGSGTTNNSYWNATVSVKADDISFENIILENSFNQYQSELAAKDIIVKQSSAKEGDVTRADIKALDPKVQEKSYVERAAALAIYNNVKRNYYEGCRIIGHQDTLYGGTGVTAGFYNCDIYGGTDYIFGGMTAVFAKCNLVANTVNVDAKGNAKNDTFYITAPQQSNGRGYLMYNCNVISTTPGVDTIATETSKQGYFGRPWQANTSETVFYATNVGTTNIPVGSADVFPETLSLIRDEGWLNSLGGSSNFMYEFGTYEASGVDNSKKRAAWVNPYAALDKAVIAQVSENKLNKDLPLTLTKDNAVSTFLGDWDAFKGKDMTIVQALERNTTFEPVSDNGEGGETTPSENKTEEQKANDALKESKGAAEDTIAVTVTDPTGKAPAQVDLTKVTVSADGVARAAFTIAKGSKVQLVGYDKASSKQYKTANKTFKKNAAINGKGLLVGKNPANNVVLKYALTGGTPAEITVNIMDVTIAAGQVSENAATGSPKKLAMTYTSAGAFDIVVNAPLTANVIDAKVKLKGVELQKVKNAAGVESNLIVGSDGKLHIRGTIAAKQSASVPINVYGKKLTIKIKSKIK